jgi:hypothetical protein
MADTRIQLEVENWIRTQWLPQKYCQAFKPCRLRLNTGGFFDFDAVSVDGLVVANISTSSSLTSSGNNAVAKIQKLRADMLFLLMAPARTRLIVLSEQDMFDLCVKEKKNGRVPVEIEFDHAEIPDYFKRLLIKAKRLASDEVTPKKASI